MFETTNHHQPVEQRQRNCQFLLLRANQHQNQDLAKTKLFILFIDSNLIHWQFYAGFLFVFFLYSWLVVTPGTFFIVPYIGNVIGMPSSQLTFIFFGEVGQPPTRFSFNNHPVSCQHPSTQEPWSCVEDP